MGKRNIALAYLETIGSPRREDLECVEVMGDVIGWAEENGLGKTFEILWIEPVGRDSLWPKCYRHLRWKHHCVPVIDGLVHDAWHGNFMSEPERYAELAFPYQDVRLEWIDREPDRRAS